MREIGSREDVSELIRTFYAKIRRQDVLGPIFNEAVDDWEFHLEKLTDFWETNIFFVRKYKGNPMRIHADLDQKLNQGIEQDHFDRWLALWYETVDELFIGKNAQLIKDRARSIAQIMLVKILKSRPETLASGRVD